MKGIEKITYWDVELWAAKSRKGEICGIYFCGNEPVIRCNHCGNWYCEEHKFVLDNTFAHPKENMK